MLEKSYFWDIRGDRGNTVIQNIHNSVAKVVAKRISLNYSYRYMKNVYFFVLITGKCSGI